MVTPQDMSLSMMEVKEEEKDQVRVLIVTLPWHPRRSITPSPTCCVLVISGGCPPEDPSIGYHSRQSHGGFQRCRELRGAGFHERWHVGAAAAGSLAHAVRLAWGHDDADEPDESDEPAGASADEPALDCTLPHHHPRRAEPVQRHGPEQSIHGRQQHAHELLDAQPCHFP